MDVTDLGQLTAELSHFKGRIIYQPNLTDMNFGEHDLIIFHEWDLKVLLKIARSQPCQVAIFSEVPVPEELSPFFDWRISTPQEFEKLKSMAQHVSRRSGSPDFPKSKSLFLDRDGVINVDHGYVGDPDKVELMPKIGELIARANDLGQKVIVVTNQSGIGRNYYSEQDFQQVMGKIGLLLAEFGAKIDHVEFSPFHPNSKINQYRFGGQFRKPRPGMIHKAARRFGVDVNQSVMIGDHVKDVMTAVLAGVGRVGLLASEEAQVIRNQIDQWLLQLSRGHGMTDLMNGIRIDSIGSLDEAFSWL